MSDTPGTAPVGMLGGTFDPIHFGHLHLAETARESLHLASLRFIPAGYPPHRIEPQVSPAHRLAMVRLACAANPAFTVDEREINSLTPSYSVLTLQSLRAELGPDRPLVLLVGVDAFLGLPSWYHWWELFDLAHIAVANRPGYQLPQMPPELATQFHARMGLPADLQHAAAGRIVCFDITPLAISATEIRARVAAGRSARYLCPDAVVDYITQHNLYR